MDFEFDEGQNDLQQTAARVLAKEYPAARARAVAEGKDDAGDLWQTLVSLDWPGLAISESDGGVGASAIELAIVLEQLGYVIDASPFLATTTQFAPLVAACGSVEQRRRFVGGVVDGLTGALAIADSDGPWALDAPTVSATRSGTGWELSGRACFVIDGDRADEVAVVAGTDGAVRAFVVPGIDVRAVRTPAFDPSLHVAELDLDGVTVDGDRMLDRPVDAETHGNPRDLALTGLALTAVGACQRAFELVIAYVREREQFGVPIGSFQALKHKAVDMYVAIERARALGYFAATAIAENDERRSTAASMAKAAAADAQDIVFRHSIQMFGGIGFTWENDLHLFLRRAKATSHLMGGATEHRACVARAVLSRTDLITEAES